MSDSISAAHDAQEHYEYLCEKFKVRPLGYDNPNRSEQERDLAAWEAGFKTAKEYQIARDKESKRFAKKHKQDQREHERKKKIAWYWLLPRLRSLGLKVKTPAPPMDYEIRIHCLDVYKVASKKRTLR